jgi:hypothetical protein
MAFNAFDKVILVDSEVLLLEIGIKVFAEQLAFNDL